MLPLAPPNPPFSGAVHAVTPRARTTPRNANGGPKAPARLSLEPRPSQGLAKAAVSAIVGGQTSFR